MTSDHSLNDGSNPSAQGRMPEPVAAVGLDEEKQRLAEEVKRLQHLLEMIREERDQYRRILYPDIWKLFSEEELRRLAQDDNEEGTQPLEQFFGELEDIVHGRREV